MWLLLPAICLPFLFVLVHADTFTIGYLTGSQRRPGDLVYLRPGLTISGAISLAIAEVNNGQLGRRGHRLQFTVAETFGEEIESIRQTALLWMQNVSVYIGPQETCVHEGMMAAAFNLPMISYFCTHYETSNKREFPTFARTRPPDTQISKSVASVLLAFHWTHVVFLYLNSPDFEYEKIAATILHAFQTAGITVRYVRCWDSPYHYGYMDNPFYQLVEETHLDTRIYVILGHHYEHLGLMVAMEEKKLFEKGEYWVVGVDIEQYDQDNPTKYFRGLLRDEADPTAQRAFRNYLGVVASAPVGFENFTMAVNSYMEKPPFNFPNPLTYLGGVKRIGAEAAYLYDAVHLYARALVRVLDDGGDPRNGTAIISSITRCHYNSAMGYMVYMDDSGDAEGNYTLLAQKPHPHIPAEYGLYPVGVFTPAENGTNLPILHLTSAIHWSMGRPPIASPPCGFRGEKCITHTVEITAGVAGSALLAVVVAALVLYRNWRYEQELDSLLWKVDFKDIQMLNDPAFNLGTKLTRAIHPLMRTSQVSLSSNPDADFRYSSIFAQIGIYKGRVFAVKKVHKKSIDITREMKKELKMMRDVRHDNLNAFIGACTDPPNICIVTEYCARGSLKDILENEDVKLDNMFIASLVGDILRGMIYLHDSPVRFHGALHTGNCLVDSRWVVKIADFGLHEFKRGAEDHTPAKDPATLLDRCQRLLYRAPELLRSSHSYIMDDQPKGSQRGDVYSFGVILYELHGRHGPFGDTGLSAAEMLHRILHPTSPTPYRPLLDHLENSFDFVRDCLKECWAENPDDRPEFKSIRTKLRPLRKGMKPNIFDNMMAMMEKYANNLEVLVDERTDQLQEEKKKTEALLYEMLPRSVAEQLKKGNKVEAESFDSVTIYFSDIVGFTGMSAESTPLQVVDFLNDLYTCFDSIIEHYDVYKVETIGDAYMVVSGLPIRNGDQHAGEIATMSLHLLGEVKQFKIRHRPTEKVKLRIGLHSGPVCAGVVGLKMPRYCLFGDTVNTASRMESTGSPLKVHCSKDTKELLSRLNGYNLVERGVVPMKGKGEQMTYWLVGEDATKHSDRLRERNKRRALLSGALLKNGLDNGQCLLPRSSLKNRSLIRSPIPRCSSLESPKKLRFASSEIRYRNESLLEAIADNSPCKKSSGSLVVENVDCCEALRTCSTSCPCIENLANSTATLAHSQLSMLVRNEKPSYLSVPSLHKSHLGSVTIQAALSAPVSPNKRTRLKFDCEHWSDVTPLLIRKQDTNV